VETRDAERQRTVHFHYSRQGKHEETMATSSRATATQGGHYLVVLNLPETDYVCNYIRHGGSKDEFLTKFAGSHSPGFIPTGICVRRRGEPDDHAAQ